MRTRDRWKFSLFSGYPAYIFPTFSIWKNDPRVLINCPLLSSSPFHTSDSKTFGFYTHSPFRGHHTIPLPLAGGGGWRGHHTNVLGGMGVARAPRHFLWGREHHTSSLGVRGKVPYLQFTLGGSLWGEGAPRHSLRSRSGRGEAPYDSLRKGGAPHHSPLFDTKN